MNQVEEELVINEDSLLWSKGHKEINPALFEAIKNGDEAAFSAYYNKFADSLVVFINRIIGNEEEAKEIVQDVFVMLWECRDRIEPDKKLTSYIYGIGRNMAYKVVRRRRVQYRYENEVQFTYDDLGIAADENFISKETYILVRRALNQMPPQRRRVFELSRYEGMSYDEIAKEMNLSQSTVRKHLQLALKDLRTAISVLIFFLLIGH